MLIASGFVVLSLLVIGNAFSAFTVWLQHKYAWEIAHNISTRLLKSYLKRPYQYFLYVNTSILLNKALVEVVRFTKEVLIQIIELAARLATALVIFALLVFVDPILSLIALGSLAGTYLVTFLISRNYLEGLGENRTKANENLFKSLNEALTGIKTVKLYDAESLFYRRFEAASNRLIRIYPRVKLISDTPRFVIEILAFGGILGIILYLLIKGENVQDILPLLSLYALAGYRLLPALQKAFTAASTLKHSYNSVDKIQQDLEEATSFASSNYPIKDSNTIPFTQKISLMDVDFSFRDKSLFDQLNLEITKGSTVALAGATGSGKTTLVDLIVGLLEPDKGSIEVDGVKLTENNRQAWNQQIGYVPQEVFLIDDSISRNIALGQQDQQIDQEKVKEAARMAKIHDFIVNDLPHGYDSNVGDRGVRLSGGQRQRIGLARAFYRSPELLILDEATNALDSITEAAVIDSIKNAPRDFTVIVIAHRLSTVKHADRIVLLNEGKILDQGNYQTLLDRNEVFKTMTEIN